MRPEIRPSGRIKLEKASAALNRSANNVLNTVLDSLEDEEITQVIAPKLGHPEAEQTPPKARRRIIIKRRRDTTGMF